MEAQGLYKDVEPVEQTAPDGRKVKAYPAEHLKFLTRIGHKKKVVRAKYGSRRVRESIVTIARMIAQLKLKDVIDAEDAKETQAVFNIVLEPAVISS